MNMTRKAALLCLTLLVPALSRATMAPVRVPLPAITAPAEGPAMRAIRRLEVAPGDGLLLVVRLGGHPYHYDLLDAAGQPLWQAQDECCAGAPPWDVLLSPAGAGALVLYPDGRPRAQYKLLLPGRPPQALSQFSGGAWAADGSWFGGSMGSYGADGQIRSVGVPRPKTVSDLLFSPGPTKDTLRYVADGQRYQWDGSGAPRAEGPWACAPHIKDRNLDGPFVAPVRFSADGRFVAWAARGSTDLISVCDSQGGREHALGEVSSYAWAGDRELYYVSGQVLHRRVFPEGPDQTVALPRGITPSAVAVAGGWLYVGAEHGEVYKLPRR